MTTIDELISELHREAERTRRLLERVPEGELTWAPHPRSMTLGQLALHIATMPRGVAELAGRPVAEVPDTALDQPTSSRELLRELDATIAAVTAHLAAWGDDGLREEWRLVRGDQTLMTLPRHLVLRDILFNHLYHHRGQLTVYLRLLDVPLPATYGPSADESPFG